MRPRRSIPARKIDLGTLHLPCWRPAGLRLKATPIRDRSFVRWRRSSQAGANQGALERSREGASENKRSLEENKRKQKKIKESQRKPNSMA